MKEGNMRFPMTRAFAILGMLGGALAPALHAQQVLTSVSQPGFAYVDGDRAVYLDYPASKTAVIEIDLDTKAKKTLLPEAGATPYYIDFGVSGDDLAYVSFSTKPQYPLSYLNVRTGEKKVLDNDAGWKESVWAGGGKVVWIDYRHKTSADKNGEVYLYDLAANAGKRITNNPGYQAKPVTDGRHIAYLDYSAGGKGVLTLYDIQSGTSVVPSPVSAHQDNPRVQGDWVVWEDYRNAVADTLNADIYAYRISTKEVKPLCTQAGFQGRPFLKGQAVVWEDYRGAGGDAAKVNIWGYDLAGGKEHQVTSRAGYDASPVHDGNRLVWFGIDGSAMNLYVANLPFSNATLVRLRARTGTDAAPGLYRADGRTVERGTALPVLRARASGLLLEWR
jgi:TolB protein